VSADPAIRREIPDATVARLPEYLRALTDLAERGTKNVSSEELATAAGVRSTQLRKDLSHLGSYGVRGVGYEVDHLAVEISRALGLAQDWPVAIVGMGNLGRALAAYSGFTSGGFHVAAVFDADPTVGGGTAGDLPISPMTDLRRVIRSRGVCIGVITTPAGSAQQVCDALAAAGVRSILNFAPAVITAPAGVNVRRVDLSTELHVLAFREMQVEQPHHRVGVAR
jgi:redox-sensing transcriptional repressor